MKKFIRRFHMKHALQACVLLILVCLLFMGWIYSKQHEQTIHRLRDNNKDESVRKIVIEALEKEIQKHEKAKAHLGPCLDSTCERHHYIGANESQRGSKSIAQSVIMEDIYNETEENEAEENEMYPLDIRYFPEPIRKKHEKHLKQIDVQKHLNALKEMLKGEKLSRHIEFEEDFLKSYLISCDFKIDKAFYKIRNFVNLRENHEYFFHNMSFDFTQDPAYRFVTILPYRLKDGSITILFDLGKWDPDVVPLEHLKKVMFLISCQQLRNPVTQIGGVSFIYDLGAAGYKYLKYATPQNLKLLQHVSFEVMPVKFVAYHLVNVNAIANLMLTMIRPFLPAYIESIFYTHSSVTNLHDFYSPSMLPVQFGGNLTDYFVTDWIRKANQDHGDFPEGGQKNIF